MPVASKYSETVAHQIADSIRKGLSFQYAAALVGISTTTLHRWYEKGSEGVEPYDYFYTLIEKSRGELQEELLEHIRQLARGHTKENPLYVLKEEERTDEDGKVVSVVKKDYQGMDLRAATWLLERKFPKDFGRLKAVEHSGQVDIEHGGEVGLTPKDDFRIVIVDPKDEK